MPTNLQSYMANASMLPISSKTFLLTITLAYVVWISRTNWLSKKNQDVHKRLGPFLNMNFNRASFYLDAKTKLSVSWWINRYFGERLCLHALSMAKGHRNFDRNWRGSEWLIYADDRSLLRGEYY